MDDQIPLSLRITSFIVPLLGIAMLLYWGMFFFQGIPLAGIPVLSELVNAVLAIISGIGLLSLRKWSIPTSIFTAGMWAYGVLGGISLVLEKSLDFSSPFGALTDTVLFPLILVFAVFLAVIVWRNREVFQ